MDVKVIYEDEDLLVVDKPAGVVVLHETLNIKRETKTLIDYLIEKKPELAGVGHPPRYGMVHRLDKDTSGILLVAKSAEALNFLQKQFITRGVEKKYLALATGTIKEDFGKIETLMGRSPADPRKQKAYSENEPAPESAREALTEWKVLQRLAEYTLLEVNMRTGRKHQIRAHLAFAHHPIAGDKLYGFKDSPTPEGLSRQFLHASYIKITLPNGEEKSFQSPLPQDLDIILKKLS